jgi:hypothetical protein
MKIRRGLASLDIESFINRNNNDGTREVAANN